MSRLTADDFRGNGWLLHADREEDGGFTAMSTTPAPILVGNAAPAQCELNALPFAFFPVDPSGRADLTIHRRTDTHHGSTLQILGHAAEYLADSRMFMMTAGNADQEAIHILMRLSREVFEEYAEGVSVRKRFHDWVMDRMVERCA